MEAIALIILGTVALVCIGIVILAIVQSSIQEYYKVEDINIRNDPIRSPVLMQGHLYGMAGRTQVLVQLFEPVVWKGFNCKMPFFQPPDNPEPACYQPIESEEMPKHIARLSKHYGRVLTKTIIQVPVKPLEVSMTELVIVDLVYDKFNPTDVRIASRLPKAVPL